MLTTVGIEFKKRRLALPSEGIVPITTTFLQPLSEDFFVGEIEEPNTIVEFIPVAQAEISLVGASEARIRAQVDECSGDSFIGAQYSADEGVTWYWLDGLRGDLPTGAPRVFTPSGSTYQYISDWTEIAEEAKVAVMIRFVYLSDTTIGVPAIAVPFLWLDVQYPVETLPHPGLPEPWQTDLCQFGLRASSGIQEIPGEAQVTSGTRRHAIILVPTENIDQDDPESWPEIEILGGTRRICGPEVLTDSLEAGLVPLTGQTDAPVRIFYIEGEEEDDARKWVGTAPGWPITP